MPESELKLTLEFESEPAETPAAKEEMLEECRSLSQLINDNVAPSRIAESGETRPGEKGVPLVIGGILINAITGGAAKALLDCIKVWLEVRKREFTFRIEKEGATIEIQSSNMNEQQIKALATELKNIL
jgi:hypothetical protein